MSSTIFLLLYVFYVYSVLNHKFFYLESENVNSIDPISTLYIIPRLMTLYINVYNDYVLWSFHVSKMWPSNVIFLIVLQFLLNSLKAQRCGKFFTKKTAIVFPKFLLSRSWTSRKPHFYELVLSAALVQTPQLQQLHFTSLRH